MTEKAFPGEFEQMVLLAILRLGHGAYAVPVREEIEQRAKRSVARGALYTTLERLETKGFLTSRMSDPSPVRGGRSRRYFAVSAAGVRSLQRSKEAMLNLWEGLDSVLEKTS